jgi:Na+-transporting NADH:ubiquinone oxidoreductase subunit C
VAEWPRRFLALSPDHPAKTVAVTLGVCLVCATVVSVAAVLLKPLRTANLARERSQHLLQILEGAPGIAELLEDVDLARLETHVVDLATGLPVPDIDPAEYDQRAAAKDPRTSTAIPDARDIAKLGRRADRATVHLVRREGAVRLVILPVHGSGFVSTLYGYLALAGDANTILGLSFYEHAETPGMGAEVNSPAWRALWRGKKVRDADGELRIRVIKGRVDAEAAGAAYEVDGLSGATRTGDGVTNLLRFWLGEDGFGPYLETIRRDGG